jgi:GT2 family glycosyltransferase
VDGSTDGTDEMVKNFAGIARLTAVTRENRGRAAACNSGIAGAAAPIVVFLDDDMEPEPQWLERHLQAHAESDAAGERHAVVGAAPVRADAAMNAAARYVAEKFNAHMRLLAQSGRDFQLRDFYSGNCSISRAVLREVGGFDESFSRYGNEDLDLSLRIQRVGVRIVFRSDAAARQHYLKDMRALALDNRAKGHTAIQLWRKHPETYADLKLSQPAAGSRRSRLVRELLLRASDSWRGVPDMMVRFADLSGTLHLPGRFATISMVLDYFYWLGVREARRELDSR